MSVFSDIHNTTDKATDIGERYIKTSRQYFKLKVFQQLSHTLTTLAKIVAFGSFAFLGIIFLAVALALKIGELLDSIVVGYLIVGLIFIVIAAIVYAIRERITKLIIKSLSLKFFN
ncbi:MAG: phage holin family protein [Winogradskyella sp.]|uniref:phage holin family protein n=1 Tax=Winogradskyella sp. TaxID=1883156 RepID=UPI0017C77C25|nr:phage holin family protein [Winogradskyella sp.]